MPVESYNDFARNMSDFDNITTRKKNAASNMRNLMANKAAIDSTNSVAKQYNDAIGRIVMGKSKNFAGSNTSFGTSVGSSNVVGGSKMERFLNAVRQQESGGRYGVKGIQTKGSRALGAYQVMGFNVPAWTKAALGRSVSQSTFLGSKKIQDQVARHILGGYVKKYGYGGAAAAWYGGPGAGAKYSRGVRNRRSQYGGPSIAKYVQQVLARM